MEPGRLEDRVEWGAVLDDEDSTADCSRYLLDRHGWMHELHGQRLHHLRSAKRAAEEVAQGLVPSQRVDGFGEPGKSTRRRGQLRAHGDQLAHKLVHSDRAPRPCRQTRSEPTRQPVERGIVRSHGVG